MARTKQRLINYHTSGATVMPKGEHVEYGEIVVRHNEANPELLIKVGEDSFGVFQASGAVKSAIDSAVSAAKSEVNGNISNLEKSLSAHTAEFVAFQEEVEETFATKDELNTAKTDIESAYTKAVADAKAEAIETASSFTISQVSAAEGRLNGEIQGVSSNLDALSGQVKSISTNIGDNYVSNDALNGALETVASNLNQAKADVYSSANSYTDAEIVKAKGYTDSAITKEEGRVNALIEGVNGVIDSLDDKVDAFSAASINTFATKDDVAGDVATLTGNIATAKAEAIGEASGYTDAQIAIAKGYADDEIEKAEGRVKLVTDSLKSDIDTLSGNTADAIEELESALTETINDRVARAYRYKGSCVYADLPTSGIVVGDVWNVTDANGDFPAGTNYAWDGEKWDALGGSIDLSPYATTEYVDGKVSAINTVNEGLKSQIDTVSAETKAMVDAVSAATVATYATKVELQTAKTDIESAYTKAIADAKAEAIATASAYTDTQVSDAEGRLNSTINGVSNKVDTLSATTVTIQGVANSAVQTASADCGATVKKEGTELKFSFAELVIDCGDF